MAERVVADEVAKLGYLRVTNGAAMITDAKTGGVLAMVGSRDYYANDGGNFNVTTANRQPGSSIKPITYATAFKLGYSPGNILLDTQTSFKNAWETYTPVNYDGKFHGPVSIRQSLGSSYNIPAVKMLALVGIENMVQTARDMGISTFNDLSRFGLSLTLGGGEVKMTDMMSAYGTFANNGVRHNTTGIAKVMDSNGVIIEDSNETSGVKVLSPGVAYLINSVLSDNAARTPAFGPNSLLNIPGHTVAVKTGTTDLKRDNWTFGYTPDYVVGVWVGNNNNTPMDQSLSSGVTGAAPIWNKIMTELLKDQPNVAFIRPNEVSEIAVDGKRDLGILGISNKSALTIVKKKEKEGDIEKDVVTFTDPFSKQAETPKTR
jgi:membrane peptidoglycan carboxypeptidase